MAQIRGLESKEEDRGKVSETAVKADGTGAVGRRRKQWEKEGGSKKTMNKWLHERVRGKYGAKWIKVHKRTGMKEKQSSSRRFSSKDFVKEELQSGRKC